MFFCCCFLVTLQAFTGVNWFLKMKTIFIILIIIKNDKCIKKIPGSTYFLSTKIFVAIKLFIFKSSHKHPTVCSHTINLLVACHCSQNTFFDHVGVHFGAHV